MLAGETLGRHNGLTRLRPSRFHSTHQTGSPNGDAATANSSIAAVHPAIVLQSLAVNQFDSVIHSSPWLSSDPDGSRPHRTAATGTWNVNADGTWNTNGNWTAAFPNGAGQIARITNNISAARVITIPTAVGITIGEMDIGDPTSSFFGFSVTASRHGESHI